MLYTDGVTEAMNVLRMRCLARSGWKVRTALGNRPVKEIIQGIRQELTDFTHKETQEDDITILVCRILDVERGDKHTTP